MFFKDAAWHEADPRKLKIAPLVADWQLARDVLEGDPNATDPVVGRVLLDESLDFKTSATMVELSDCCHGCYAYVMTFKTLPSAMMILLVCSVVLAQLPLMLPTGQWDLNRVYNTGAALSIFLAQIVVLLALKGVATALVFMRDYQPALASRGSEILRALKLGDRAWALLENFTMVKMKL